MTIDELKKTIEERTGVPASLLTGETAEENIAQAKAMLAYKREYSQKRPQTTAEQFSAWMNAQLGEAPQNDMEADLDSMAGTIRASAGGYPAIRDGGAADCSKLPDARPARELFAEWAGEKMAFDPAIDADGWKTLV